MEKRTDNNDNIGASFPEDIEINTAERSYGPIGDEAAPGSERTPGIVDGTTGSFHRVGTQDLSEDTPEKTPWYKKPFIRKIGYALIALFIALTLWGYVLMSENPVRIKRVNNVSLSFESGSEADLKSRGLIISGDIGSILPEIAVNVRTTLNDLPRFNASMDDIVTATISLNDIREPGTYVRKIVATSSIGTVESVEPSTVTITVEDLVSRMIPVKCSFTNSLPDGYWRDEPELATSSITISGAESAISSIRSANCVIDLSGRTDEIYEAFPVILLDAQQEVVDPSVVEDILPSVIVRMTILPYQELRLDQYITQVGELSEDLEISSISINPAYLRIAAPQEDLDTLGATVYIEPISVSAFTAADTYTQKISVMGLPSSAVLLTDNNFIITIEIVDRIVSKTFTFELEPDDIIGEKSEDYEYAYNTLTCTVDLTGPAMYLKYITENDLSLTLDVGSFSRGRHEVRPFLRIRGNPDWQNDGSVQISISTVICTISTKPAE